MNQENLCLNTKVFVYSKSWQLKTVRLCQARVLSRAQVPIYDTYYASQASHTELLNIGLL